MAKTPILVMIGSALLLGGGATCSATSRSPAKIERSEGAFCTRLVEDYVVKTRGWDKSDYEVREESAELGGRGFSVWHASDNRPKALRGGGKSFHLEVDRDCRRVVKELAYQ